MIAQVLPVIDRLRIFRVRGHPEVLDSDLAAIYGVRTSNFNKALRRNRDRSPEDFCFLKLQFGTSGSPGGRRRLPWVLTEHGAITAATIPR